MTPKHPHKGVFVKDLRPGERFTGFFQARHKQLEPFRDRSKGNFLTLILSDRSGQILARVWEQAPDLAGTFEVGVHGRHGHHDVRPVLLDEVEKARGILEAMTIEPGRDGRVAGFQSRVLKGLEAGTGLLEARQGVAVAGDVVEGCLELAGGIGKAFGAQGGFALGHVLAVAGVAEAGLGGGVADQDRIERCGANGIATFPLLPVNEKGQAAYDAIAVEQVLIDDAVQVTDDEALEQVFDLQIHEGISIGGSAGINVAAAIKVAKAMGPGHRIVTLLCDGGARYQSKLFNPEFLRGKGLPVPPWLA